MKTRQEIEDYVKNFLYNKETHKFSSGRTGKAYLIRHGWYDSIMNYYDDSNQMIEILYRILNGIDKKPVCKMCGKPVKFCIHESRYNFYCSRKCQNSNPDMKKINAASVSNALKKVYQERGTEVKAKRQQALKEHYGSPDNPKEKFTSPFSIPKIQKKGKQTLIKHYGVDNVFKDKEWKKKMMIKVKNTVRKKFHQKCIKFGYDVEYHNNYVILKNECPVHGNVKLFYQQFDNRCLKKDRNWHGKLACPICNPERNPETSIEFKIKEILNEFNLNFKEHDRSVLRNPKTNFPLELDFYLPDNRLAIECNGTFWHSGHFSRNYDVHEKTRQCHEKGIQLLTFWEDEINDPKKLNDIKNLILNKVQHIEKSTE